jgi:phasin family protein
MTTTTESAPKKEAPRLSIDSLLERLKLPGLDAKELVASRRKDIEALLEANERAYAAWGELGKKQIDLLQEVMKEWQASARGAIAETGAAERLNLAAEHAGRAFTHALSGMKELAEIAARSSREVAGILSQRYRDAVDELRATLRPKA